MKPSLHFLPAVFLPAILSSQILEVKKNQPDPEIIAAIQSRMVADDETVTLFDNNEWQRPELKDARIHFLSEVNRDESAEAYPWLSDDGLRLYVVHNDAVEQYQRNSTDEKFGAPKVIVEGDYSVVGQWLNATETEIWFTTSGGVSLLHSTRKDINSEFEKIDEVNLEYHSDPYEGFISGPSLTEDGNELYLFYSGNENRIDKLEKRNNRYEYRSSLRIPFGEPGPGKLSSDGLSYYVSIESDGGEKIYVAHRDAIGDVFSEFEVLLAGEELPMYQPCAIGGGKIIAFTGGDNKYWEQNDVYIWYGESSVTEPASVLNKDEQITEINLQPANESIPEEAASTEQNGIELKSIFEDDEIPKVFVYPNPAITSARIVLSEIPEDAEFILYDLSGRVVLEKGSIAANEFSVELSTVSAGMYIYSIADGDELIGQGKFNVAK